MKVSVSISDARKLGRPEAYINDIIANGTGKDWVRIEADTLAELKRQHGIDSCCGPVRGLGDIIELAVKPIAKALSLPCLDDAGRLKPDSGCAKRRDALNKAVPLTSGHI